MIAIDCVACKNERRSDVPFCVYEAQRTRHKKVVQALIFALIISVACNFVSNALWMSAEVHAQGVHYEEVQDG